MAKKKKLLEQPKFNCYKCPLVVEVYGDMYCSIKLNDKTKLTEYAEAKESVFCIFMEKKRK